MDYVAVEDGVGCVDREAMEIAAPAALGPRLFDAFTVDVEVREDEGGYLVQTAVACDPSDDLCRRRRIRPDEAGHVFVETAHVVRADCPAVHDLVLATVRARLDALAPPTSEVERRWSVGGGMLLGASVDPVGPWASFAVVATPGDQDAPAHLGLAARTTVALPVAHAVPVSDACHPATSCLATQRVWLAAAVAGPTLEVSVGGPLRLEAGALFGLGALWGTGHIYDKSARVPWLDLEAGLGLDFGRSGTWMLLVQEQAIPVEIEASGGAPSTSLQRPRVAVGLVMPF